MDAAPLTLAEAAERVGVGAPTLRRWLQAGLVPQYEGAWTPAAVGAARLVARMRERGHTIADLRRATEQGRLAFGFLQDLFPLDSERIPIEEASARTGLDEALIVRLLGGLGLGPPPSDWVSADDLAMLADVADVLEVGFPLVALLQLVRVYGQTMARVADAEVRLFHLYVHEPLMRSGATGVETAERMDRLGQRVLPLAEPILEAIHRRFLHHFVEQDVVGHMEADLADADADLGRMRVAIAFADLAGYTQLTEEEGELTAVDAVERFVDAVEHSLPDTARVIKTIGDEAMVIGADAGTLVRWAVAFQADARDARPRPRIAVHDGVALYRDGDYFGRDVNIASRVAARASGGEVLVTRPVLDAVARGATPAPVAFAPVGEVTLRGFAEPIELFAAEPRGRRR